MKKIIFPCLLISLFTSCSTLFNQTHYPIVISSNVANAKISVNDRTFNLPSEVLVERSRKDLIVHLESDTITRDFEVRSSVSPRFLTDNLVWLYAAPIGYIVDLTNSKRFYYGHTIFLNTDDSDSVIYTPLVQGCRDYFARQYPKSKGQWNLILSFPWVNQFSLNPPSEDRQNSIGFWGISAGVEMYYQPDKFITINASTNTDFFFPFPVPYDAVGMEKRSYANTLSITHNTCIRRFTVGYGLSYSQYTWDIRQSGFGDHLDSYRKPANRKSQSIGLIANGYYQLSKNFYLGLIYKPSFLELSPDTQLEYEHLISLDFSWKFKVVK